VALLAARGMTPVSCQEIHQPENSKGNELRDLSWSLHSVQVLEAHVHNNYTVSLCLNRETKIFSSAALTIRDQMFSVNIDLLLLKKIGNRFDCPCSIDINLYDVL